MYKLLAFVFSLVAFNAYSTTEETQEKPLKTKKYTQTTIKNFDLMLVGGGLKTCSSLSTKHCQSNDFSPEHKGQNLYQLTENQLNALLKSSAYLQQSETWQDLFKQAILHIYAKQQNKILSKSLLKDAFGSFHSEHANGSYIYQNMPLSLYYAMLDHLEVRQLTAQQTRKREVVDLGSNKNQASSDIYRAFVNRAARLTQDNTSPTIAVVTASARDPFEVADFYLSAFEQAAGNNPVNVIWLPLTASYQQARGLEKMGFAGCQKLTQLREHHNLYDRERIYPERTALQQSYCHTPEQMLTAIAHAQGIFFNGGDQSLTLAALTQPDGSDSDELRLIKQRLSQKQLIVGGTSAGTAVQSGGVFAGRPVPMVTNGHSENAFQRGIFATPPPAQGCNDQRQCAHGLQPDDMTYKAQGGTALFSLGILDTHFSERDREARLAFLTQLTESRFGFGVDEATALLVDEKPEHITMGIIGQGGVWVNDNQGSRYQKQQNHRSLTFTHHYLSHGAKMTFDKKNQSLGFTLPETTTSDVMEMKKGIWRNTLTKDCQASPELNWQAYGIHISQKATDESRWAKSTSPYGGRCHYLNIQATLSN